MSERKRPNQAGGFTPEARSHAARLRYIAIEARRFQGASRAQVCEEFDVSMAVVIRARRELGRPKDGGRRGQPKPWLRKDGPSAAVRARLAMVADGLSYRQVAARARVTRQAVADDVRRWPEVLEAMKEGDRDG